MANLTLHDQSVNYQVDALSDCDEIFIDEGISGAERNRPELERMVGVLDHGDEVVVWKLDRLGRSLQHLVELVSTFITIDIIEVPLHRVFAKQNLFADRIDHLY